MLKFKQLIASLSVVTVLSTGAYIANEEYSTVALAIHLDDHVIDAKVKKGTVKDILEKQGIYLSNEDRVEPGIDAKINKDDIIRIYKARDIIIKDGGKEETRKTTYKKVADILKELNITLGEHDKISQGLDTEVQAVDTIEITRVEKTTETKKEEIKFETKEEVDNTLAAGERKVKTAGKNGEKEISINVVKENGKIISENKVSENVLTEPVAEVVLVGAKQEQVVAVANNLGQVSYVPVAQAQKIVSSGGGIVLANGNTAGEAGLYAAQQMEARTGVPAATWEHIIARESNGQVGARNASGAAGLFQTMPGWGSTATVEDQINAATRAYQNQGLAAWGM